MHTLPYHFGDDDEWSPSEGGDGGEAVMEVKRSWRCSGDGGEA
jgi:hypothetical protein